MVVYTRKMGGKRRRTRRHKSKATKRKSRVCIKCHKRVRGYKKYCAICRHKKQSGGGKSGVYTSKPAGYSVGSSYQLRGRSSALANPPPYKSYKS
tara:strand:+ start:1193 stop:1477 length:285 start_codon:yes stop_codon:yes gene_type:complete